MKATYTLRLPEELRKKIEAESSRNKMSINQYILYTLTKDVTYKEAVKQLTNRIKQAPSRKEALELLESVVPDIPPLPDDEIPSTSA